MFLATKVYIFLEIIYLNIYYNMIELKVYVILVLLGKLFVFTWS